MPWGVLAGFWKFLEGSQKGRPLQRLGAPEAQKGDPYSVLGAPEAQKGDPYSVSRVGFENLCRTYALGCPGGVLEIPLGEPKRATPTAFGCPGGSKGRPLQRLAGLWSPG